MRQSRSIDCERIKMPLPRPIPLPPEPFVSLFRPWPTQTIVHEPKNQSNLGLPRDSFCPSVLLRPCTRRRSLSFPLPHSPWIPQLAIRHESFPFLHSTCCIPLSPSDLPRGYLPAVLRTANGNPDDSKTIRRSILPLSPFAIRHAACFLESHRPALGKPSPLGRG